MKPEQAADLIAGMLVRQEVPFQTREDGLMHRVVVGSTAVHMNVGDWGNDVVIGLSAPVLEDLPEEGDEVLKSLVFLNGLNCQMLFGKFCRYADYIAVEHDLLGSNLQGEELMNALGAVASLADEWDDKLQKELGGSTWEAKERELTQSGEPLET